MIQEKTNGREMEWKKKTKQLSERKGHIKKKKTEGNEMSTIIHDLQSKPNN